MEMDCLRTQATLSALHDGESVIEEHVEAARAHVSDCDQCGTFESDLGGLAGLAIPCAPAGLIDDIMVTVAAIAAERTLERQSVTGEDAHNDSEDDSDAPRFAWFTGRARWGTFGAVAVVAASVALFTVISTRGPAAPSTAERTAGSVKTDTAGAIDLTFSGQSTAPAASAPTPAPASAPDYVAYKGRVYAPGALLAQSTAATESIGTVSTAFGTGAGPSQTPAYRSPITDGSIVVAGPEGARLYTPVVRLFQSVRYHMVAGNAVERFGVWPELPARFAVPTSPEGSPTFTVAGGDALGVKTFTARGVTPEQGFAVAPGTTANDPAASNPNWTWWEPLLVP